MCGIVGYVGSKDARPVLLGALERVTYRGYDSFGLAFLNGRGLEVFKGVGSVDQHRDEVNLSGNIGIGHTRWATVGAVSERNAHPHLDCSGDIAIVHNGDIDNFRELRDRLLSKGHSFQSETDSEVIAHLIEVYRPAGLISAVQQAVTQLEGSYAILVLDRRSRHLVVTRKGSPVVIGLGDNECFVASDAPALVPYTRRVVYLQDGDFAMIGNDRVQIWNDGKEVSRAVHQVNWAASEIEKNGYEHFMLKEILEQPQAIRNTLGAYGAGLPDFPIAHPDHLLFSGCGTSYHAALIGEDLVSPRVSYPVTAKIGSELTNVPPANGNSVAVALSQSGETLDTITAVKKLKDSGWKIVSITNVQQSSLSLLADTVLHTGAGPEIAVAATKTFTSQLVLLYLLTSQLTKGSGTSVFSPSSLRALPGKVQQTIAMTPGFQSAAEQLAKYEHMFVIAKGRNIPVAMEAALKFKEVAYLHAEACPAGELKHGPFALLGPEASVLAIMDSATERTRMLTAIREIKARGSLVVALTDRDDEEVEETVDLMLPVPSVNSLLTPMLFTVATQLLAYYCARIRGCPIDRPRNLAKSVTVP